MAKPKNKRTAAGSATMLAKKYLSVDYAKKLVFDPNHIAPTCWLLLFGELLLNIFIIERVNYTEIDWRAYMQEVEGFLNGTLDYQYLKGDTGPCVYPAGFLYIYSILHYITSSGSNIHLAQYIFMFFYIAQTYLTYEIYKKTCKVPAYALVLSAVTSYRIHSIYVLRLFNDPIAVLLFYYSLHCFLNDRWKLGSFVYSLAVSIKMNILLYAPCLLAAYLTNLTYMGVVVNLFICGVVQVILGAPFLYANPVSYLKASFDLGRVFEHKWTVNYRFLDREIFEDQWFHLGLLVLHIGLLLLFLPAIKRYLVSYATLRKGIMDMKSQTVAAMKERRKVVKRVEEESLSREQQEFLDGYEKQLKRKGPNGVKQRKKAVPQQVDSAGDEKYEINFAKISQLMVLPFFVTNLIGIVCARSLHYQFYSWYFHSLMYLVHCTPYKKPLVFLLLGVIEFSWNVYPSTDFSSALLHISHIALLVGVYKVMRV